MATAAAARSEFNKLSLKTPRRRLGRSWSDRGWRMMLLTQIAGKEAPFNLEKQGSITVGEGRLRWSEMKPGGAIWDQPVRNFA